MPREPFSEILVALVGDAPHDSGPIEARSTIVSALSIGKEDECVQSSIREQGLGVVRVGDIRAERSATLRCPCRQGKCHDREQRKNAQTSRYARIHLKQSLT